MPIDGRDLMWTRRCRRGVRKNFMGFLLRTAANDPISEGALRNIMAVTGWLEHDAPLPTVIYMAEKLHRAARAGGRHADSH